MDQLKLKLREYYQRIQDQQPRARKGNSGTDEVMELENDILTQFGLPVSKRFVQILHDFTDHNQVNEQLLDDVSKKLRAAASKYLLSPVMSDQELLNHARDQKRSPYDVLPELGYPTHDYAIFLVGELLYRRKMAVTDILDELKKAQRHEIWDKAVELTTVPDHKKHALYVSLQRQHLRFVDDFVQYTHRKTARTANKKSDPAQEGYKPNFHTIAKAQVAEIMIEENGALRLSGKMKVGVRPGKTVIGLEFSEFSQVLASCGDMGEAVSSLLAKRIAEVGSGKQLIIDLKSELGDVLQLDNCFLEVYKPQHLSNGKWVETREAFYHLDKILSKKEFEKRVKEEEVKQKIQECLELVGGSYVAYQRLRRIGITEDEAKLRAGLQDELLFKLSYYLHKLKD